MEKDINIRCVICDRITPYYLPIDVFGEEAPYCRLHRYDALCYLYERVLKRFSNEYLVRYELVREEDRVKYINPLLKELGKTKKDFDNDMIKYLKERC